MADDLTNPTPPESLKKPRNYEVGAEVARGGMGAILSARDRNLHRTVAMKVIPSDAPVTESQALRFVEEAQVTAQLEHPGIVPVHELGVDERGQLFYTMKLVKGVTLKHVLNDPSSKYSLVQLLTVFQKICDAVGFAHSKGVLHRDLKPDNVMLGEFGEVLVLDWGLAKVLRAGERVSGREGEVAPSPILPLAHSSLTMDGAILGTPQYMAPEQAAGRSDQIDARTDIYALGAILYNILTLLPPVEGATTAVALANAAENRVVPPEERAPDRHIPRELSAIAMKCLAKERDDRYQNVADLRRDIDLFLEGRSVSAHPDTLLRALCRLVVRHRTISIAAAIIVALSAGFTARVIAEGRRAERALAELRSSSPVHYAQARSLIEQSKFEDALDRISHALDFDPHNADYHCLKAHICQTLLRLCEARDEYAQALALNPNVALAAVNLKLCDEILRRDKDATEPSPESLQQLVLSLRNQGRFEEAISLAQRLSNRKQLAQATWKAALEKAGVTVQSLTVFDDGTLAVDLRRTKLSDLAPLKGMPIATLDIAYTAVANLEPLAGMPLESLSTEFTKVTDLSPLRGMKLKRLVLNNLHCFDLSPLCGMPLTELRLIHTACSDLSPLKGMPLTVLLCERSDVTDLTPLEGMPLEAFGFTPKNIVKGIEIVRAMKTIRRITNHLDWPDRGWQKPADFWKKYDAGEFN